MLSLPLGVLACTRASAPDPAATVDPDHPTVVHVSWSSDEPVSGWVEFGLDGGELDHRSPADAPTAEHAQWMLGLKAGQRYAWRVVEDGPDGQVASDTRTIDVPPPAAELPPLSVTVHDPSATMNGRYVMVAGALSAVALDDPTAPYYVAILDEDGDYVWYHILPEGLGTNGAAVWSDHRSVWWMENHNDRQDADANLRRIRLDGEEVSLTFAPTGHHASVELPGGRIAHPGRRFFPGEVAGTTDSADRVMIVRDGDATGADALELFDYLSDWWRDDLDYYWLGPCEEQFDDTFGYDTLCDLTHTNSLAYVAEENALYVYPRALDTLLKLDADTGELQWLMGGPHGEFSAEDLDARGQLWSHGHFAQVWDGGMMMFDNGNDYHPPRSSLVEIAWDEAGRVVRPVWRFDDPEGGFTISLGDARKLDSGHYMGSWMSLSKINEITPDGRIVWEVRATDGSAFRRIVPLGDLYDLR